MDAETVREPRAAHAVELCGVRKTFLTESGEAVVALDGIDLKVQEGEFLSIIGPTGCGKTTLLNILAGLDSPDSGTVRYADGLRPGDNVPCVFQHYTLLPWRTILRNVTFGLEMRHAPRRERANTARALLAKVGLEGFERAYPHELSGGMRQRAAIAQALAIQPGLLLMDEPFGALDDATRGELQQTLTSLWQDSPITIIFVTHNIDEAILMADRVVVFSERPAKVRAEFKVELPRPRDQQSEAFTSLFIQVRGALPLSAG